MVGWVMAFEEIAPQRKEEIITTVLIFRSGFCAWSEIERLYKGAEITFAKTVNKRLDQAQLEIALGGIIAEYITLAEEHGAQDGK